MKTALYMEDGRLQVVFTPENEHEKQVLRLVDEKQTVRTYRGSFYGCRGGWTRWDDAPYRYGYGYGEESRDDKSLIFVLDDKAPARSNEEL